MLRIEIVAVTCETKGFVGKIQVSNGKAVDTQIDCASKSWKVQYHLTKGE
jgi:hypothetical protein